MAFEATELDHENAGISYRRVLLYVGGFLVFAALLMLVVGFLYRHEIRSTRVVEPYRQFAGPQLQPNPGQDWINYREAQDKGLQGTRWVDPGKTLIHVPITRAMDYVAGRGAQAYDPLEAAPTDAKLPPTPSDGENRASTFPHVAPYGLRPQ